GGVATFNNLAIQRTGSYSLDASSAGLTGATSSTFSITPSGANKLAFTVQPSNAVAGAAISPAIQVTIQDQYGNTVTTSTATVTVALHGPGQPTLFPYPTLFRSGGVATFNNLAIQRTGSYSLDASSAGLTGATSSTFNITPSGINK